MAVIIPDSNIGETTVKSQINGVCPYCQTENAAGSRYCEKCGKAIIGETNKNPTLALILSLFLPGVGQLYNGDSTKGIVLLLTALFLGIPTLGIIYLGCWIYGLVDAYQVASGEKAVGKWF